MRLATDLGPNLKHRSSELRNVVNRNQEDMVIRYVSSIRIRQPLWSDQNGSLLGSHCGIRILCQARHLSIRLPNIIHADQAIVPRFTLRFESQPKITSKQPN